VEGGETRVVEGKRRGKKMEGKGRGGNPTLSRPP